MRRHTMFGFLRKKKKKKEAQQETPKPVKQEVVEETPEEPEKKDVKEEKKETPKKKRQAAMHITKHKDGGWQVKRENAQRALRKFDTQKEAIEYAKKIEDEKGIGYIIHKADGSTRKKRY